MNGVVFFIILGLGVLVSTQDIDSLIYTDYGGNPCVLLLDSQGQYGCRTSRYGIVGPLKLVNSSDEFQSFITSPPGDPCVLVMPSKLLAITNAVDSLKNTGKVNGILLLDSENPTESFSPERNNKASNSDFTWNPYGNSLFYSTFSFPLWLLTPEDSRQIYEKALDNRQRGDQFPLNSAEITSFMHPEPKDSSPICLRRGTCKPLGGNSFWTSINPLVPEKKIVMAMAGIDTKSLFQLKTIGANSAMSGTVGLMAALDALVSNPKINITLFKQQLVFAWFDGESFGSIGSTRFVEDIMNYQQCVSQSSPANCGGGSAEYQKISLDNISSIIELKQVGAPTDDISESNKFYVHTNDHQVNGVAPKTLLDLGASLQINVTQASTQTPGIPPSSLTTFIKKKPELAQIGLVLTDHYSSYSNKYYDSIFDGSSNVDPQRVCKAATLLARSLYLLANEITDINSAPPEFKDINADCDLVTSLLDCVTQNSSCSEVMSYLPGLQDYLPRFPVHYVGVYQSNPRLIDEIHAQRYFLHAWIYDKVSNPTSQNCSNSDSECAEGFCIRGVCKKSNTFYHAAVSSSLEFVITDFSAYWRINNPTDNTQIWTESDWKPIRLRLFKVSDPSYDYVFLVVAIVEALATLGVALLLRKKFELWFKIKKA